MRTATARIDRPELASRAGDFPETRFVHSGDADIAYQVIGEPGGLDLLFLPGWVSQLEVIWELAEYASFLNRLASLGRLILIDKRGSGLSDRGFASPTLEERAADVGAVLDAVGSDHAAIAAWGDGAAIASMFAAIRPERVDALVLGTLSIVLGSTAAGNIVIDPATLQALTDEVEQSWGEGRLAPILAPTLAGDERFLSWFRRWQRVSATPSAAAATLRWAAEFDLGPILPAIQAPTLIIHRDHAPFVDLAAVRQAAQKIPAARCVELPGTDDLPYAGDANAVVDEIAAFLTGERAPADPDRFLTTMLFTDIVGSTVKAEELGDRRWRYLLEEHHFMVRRLLDRFRGAEIATAGDGFFATFDGAARAVRCACAIRDAVRDIGLEIRSGLHTGEVERHGDTLAGVSVHIGARVSALAKANEILVTSTIQMLLLGSGIALEDRGDHSLKGVGEKWRLFAVNDA
jgi:pimeloyl-ACP methyl ester carboxylesterase